MTKHRPVVASAAAIAAAALGLGACGSPEPGGAGSPSTHTVGTGTAPPTIAVQIGFFGPLSGADSALGRAIEDGEKLAVSQYMVGRPRVVVTVDPFDSQGDPGRARAGAQRLVSDKDVAVVGPSSSGGSTVADPYFQRAGIPHVTASATSVALAQAGDTSFYRAVADDSVQGLGDANYLVKTLGANTVAVIDDQSSYGQGVADYFRSQLSNDGATDVVDDHIDPNGQDYSSTVDKILAAKPAAVFYGGSYGAAGRLIVQLKDQGYAGSIMTSGGSEDPRLLADAGGSAAEGAYLTCVCEDTSSIASAATFNTAFQAAYGTPPPAYSVEGYDITDFLLAAIEAGNTTPSAINHYLQTSSWEGVTRTIKFHPDGNVVGGTVYIYQVKRGKIVQVGTAPS